VEPPRSSCVVELKGGGAIETGMIGASQALDDKVSLNHVVTRLPARASAITSDRIGSLADQLQVFRGLLVKYNQFPGPADGRLQRRTQLLQARTCKCLLRMHEIAGPDLLLTQEFLARYGLATTQRHGCVAGDLQKAGMISCVRGSLHITLAREGTGPANATTTSVRTIEGSSSNEGADQDRVSL
jgi:hypothetical protein